VVVAPDPSGNLGKYVYVANSGSDNISMYTIKFDTGTLTFLGTITAGTNPASVAVDPSGRFAYVADSGSNDVSIYTIDAATGALSPTGTISDTGTIGSSLNPGALAVDSSGRFVYVANAKSSNISMYTVESSTGTLTSNGTEAAGQYPTSVAVDPTGKFAYVANASSAIFTTIGDISMFTIDANTGALTSTGQIAAGISPSVSIHPSGKFAYSANYGDPYGTSAGDISMYTIDSSTGTLTSMGNVDQSEGFGPWSMVVHSSGNFAYVVNLGDLNGDRSGLFLYDIDATSGALTEVGLADGGGQCPVSIALDPSGKFAYVADQCTSNILMYSIDSTTGALTLLGTIGT
jgi:YVTN family beta-propeller protein